MVVDAVKQFIDTPLNIHFPRRLEHKSKFVHLLDEMDIPDVIPGFVTLTDIEQKQLAELMMSAWEKYTQALESEDKYD